MKNIVLDTNVLIQHPQILGVNLNDVKLIIPSQVRFELSTLANKQNEFIKILDLLDESIKKGIVFLDENNDQGTDSHSFGQPKGDTGDKITVSYVLQLMEQNKDTTFVTDDARLLEYCTALGINAISYSAFRKVIYTLKSSATNTNEIIKKADDISKTQTKKLAFGIIIGLLIGIVLSLSFSNFNWIISKINIWGTFIVVIVAGVGLFYFRCRNRFEYGITEFAVGIITALQVFMPAFDYMTLDKTKILQLMGALYIIVRSMDNIDNGIKNKKFEPIWRKIFGNN